jgi:hypothetical protein
MPQPTPQPTPQSTAPVQAPFTAKCYGAGSIVVDKTGTVFQVWTGRLTNPGAWGPHIWRTVQGGKPQLVWFIENANGTELMIQNKQLVFSYTLPNGGQWLQPLDGYIDPSDEPSSKVVNVDESALNAVKQSVATAQTTANNADSKAMRAQTTAQNAQKTADNAKAQIATLQAQVNALQAQMLNRAQIEDIVWSKIWDVNYLIRQGFIAGSSSIQQVQDYLVDLASYIRRIVGK